MAKPADRIKRKTAAAAANSEGTTKAGVATSRSMKTAYSAFSCRKGSKATHNVDSLLRPLPLRGDLALGPRPGGDDKRAARARELGAEGLDGATRISAQVLTGITAIDTSLYSASPLS
jgi:hypothetical protein